MLLSLLSQLLGLVTLVLYYILTPIWLWLWPPLQILYLFCKRSVLRRRNLTQPITLPGLDTIREGGTPADVRTFEGSLNSTEQPTMAMSGCPFSRNTAPLITPTQGPDPVEVSEKLLKRPGGSTKTRPLVNLLGGGWIQFMIHDW